MGFTNKIAETAQLNKRLSPKEMESIILQLCKDYWLTRKQMSDLLQRNPDSLHSRFLTSMVEHGLLQLRYPDKPIAPTRHTRQHQG
jgi:ATP-dependent DNA helicase RecG